MDNQTLIIFVVLICLAPIFTLAGLALFGKIMKTARPARKRIKAEIAKNRIVAGNLHTYEVGEWVKVGEYEIIIHKVVEQHRIHKQKKERIIYIDVEYRNQTMSEELSCRRNQWYLFSVEGYKYEAESEMTAASLYHRKHYLGGESLIKPGMNLRGWLAFVLPGESQIKILQFMTAFLRTKTAEFDIEASNVSVHSTLPHQLDPQ
jgi:hypothetical protein